MENFHQGANISGRCISNLRYADDVALIAEDKDSLQEVLLKISDVSQVYSLDINVKKTKVITCAKKIKSILISNNMAKLSNKCRTLHT